jgi:hypothetical protein
MYANDPRRPAVLTSPNRLSVRNGSVAGPAPPPDLHDQELAFWQGALGQELPGIYSAEYHGAFLRGTGLMLLMQRLESGGPRVHLDIHTDDLDAEVARLERLGAERVQKVQTWWVMRDPAGLLFCVLPMSRGSHRFADIRDTRNRLATSRSLAPPSIISAAASRTCSRRARRAAVSPLPSGYLMPPA